MAIKSYLLLGILVLGKLTLAYSQCATSGTISSDCTTTGNLVITGSTLTVNPGVTVTVTGTLTVRGAGTLIATGATINAASLATAYGSVNTITGGSYSVSSFTGGNDTDLSEVNITATSTFTTGYGDFNFTNSEINVAGLFSIGSGVNNFDNTNLNTGTGNAGTNDATALTMNGGGTMNVLNGSEVNVRGGVTNNVLNIDNAEVVITGDFDNAGSEVVDVSNGGTISVGGDFNNTGSGSVTAESGGVVQVDGDYTNTGGGTTTVDGGGIVIGGTYSGSAPTGDTESGCTGGSGGCCGAACSTLPVNLIDFQVKVNNRIAEVSWSTATEEKNDYFTLLQSVDGQKFVEVDRINGSGTSSKVNTYMRTISIAPALSDMIFFKLTQTDFDGTSDTLGIVNVKVPSEFTSNHEGLIVYPNPAQSGSKIYFQPPNSSDVRWGLYDLQGKEYAKGRASNGMIEYPNAAPGTYLLIIDVGNRSLQQRVVFR